MSTNSTSSLLMLQGTFLKNDIFLVIQWFSFSAITLNRDFTVYGVIAKFADSLFCFICFTKTMSPTARLLDFEARRLSRYFFPLSFAFFWFPFASRCRFITLAFWDGEVRFPLIFLLYRSCAGGTFVVEQGVDGEYNVDGEFPCYLVWLVGIGTHHITYAFEAQNMHLVSPPLFGNHHHSPLSGIWRNWSHAHAAQPDTITMLVFKRALGIFVHGKKYIE